VQAGLKCGPLTGPNHKIVPDSRWIAGLNDGTVLARAWMARVNAAPSKYTAADRAKVAAAERGGVAIVVTSRFAIFKHAWTDTSDDALIQVPPAGFTRTATSRFYAAYVRC
jgi:hypothetical protein